MTYTEMQERLNALQTTLRSIHDEAGDNQFTEEQATRFNEAKDEYTTLRAKYDAETERRETITNMADVAIRSGNDNGTVNANPGANGDTRSVRIDGTNPPNVNGGNSRSEDNVFDLSSVRWDAPSSEFRSRAESAIEFIAERDGLAREHAEAATRLLRHDSPAGLLARHMLATGRETYRSAFQKILAQQPWMMTGDEQRAMGNARAMSLTAAAGGYAVPFTLDPTIINTKDTSTNPIRRLATTRSIVTDQWNGLTSAGVTASFDGEAAEVGDDSPSLAQPSINVHKAQAFAVGSIEITQDWGALEEELRSMFSEAKDDLEATKFVLGAGDGSDEPQGIITGLDGTSSEFTDVATAETFASADVYAVEEDLPAKYRLARMNGDTQVSSASWLAARNTYNTVRQFANAEDDASTVNMWQTIGGGLPPQLLGYNAYEASGMRRANQIDGSESADNFILAFGDWRKAYYIIDRIGLAVEFIPHVFGDNNRPTGQRGWYAHWRVGGEIVNAAAARLLNVATTA